MTLVLSIILFVVFWISVILGWYIPNNMVKPFGVLDFPPFYCRKCCTVWIMVALNAFVCVNWFNAWYLIASVILTALTGTALWWDEKRRQEEYEDEHED